MGLYTVNDDTWKGQCKKQLVDSKLTRWVNGNHRLTETICLAVSLVCLAGVSCALLRHKTWWPCPLNCFIVPNIFPQRIALSAKCNPIKIYPYKMRTLPRQASSTSVLQLLIAESISMLLRHWLHRSCRLWLMQVLFFVLFFSDAHAMKRITANNNWARMNWCFVIFYICMRHKPGRSRGVGIL